MEKSSDVNQNSMTSSSSVPKIRKTLGLTGVTINAMALIAPGAFMWLLYQSQSAAVISGSASIWPGVLGALIVSLLTAHSLGELARRYPEASLRSAYHFAEHVFREKNFTKGSTLTRAAKFITGWSAHLYYWIYPGVMVAFAGGLSDYLLRSFGYHPTLFGELILTFSFSAFVGFLALRGITGSSTSSVILNIIQLSALIIFSLAAIFFRVSNPMKLSPAEWIHPNSLSILAPATSQGLIFQIGLAMLLMVGFEASAAFGASATNPARDIPRAAVLALVIQGAFAYLFEYFAVGLAMNTHITISLSNPNAPIGDLALQIGNALFAGNGATVMLVMAFTVLIALLGSTLTAINNGVRISFSMALDEDMPDILSLLHPRYATPYVTVLLISGVSALIGSFGVIFGLPMLMGLIIASNLGALLLYGMLSGLTITAYWGGPAFNFFKHLLLPVVALIVNLGIALTLPFIGIQNSGLPAQAVYITLGIASFWLILSAAYYVLRKR